MVCGVGAAAVAWTIAGSPNVLTTECLAFVALATLFATAVSGRYGPAARSVVVAATLFSFGLGAGLLAAEVSTAAALLRRRGGRGPLFLLGMLHGLAAAAISALVPGLAYLALDGTAPFAWRPSSIGASVGYVLASVATTRALAALSGRWPGDARSALPRIAWWRDVGRESAAVVLAAVLASGYRIEDVRTWLVLLPLAALLLGARAEPDSRPTRTTRPVSAETQRAIAEALASASATRGHRDRAHVQRVEDWAVDLASDLGLRGADIDAIGSAALLHEVGVLAVPEGFVSDADGRASIEPHPALAEEILDALALPAAARAFVRHQTERWDGSGRPSGLTGERIPLGARILAVADAFDEWTWTAGPRATCDRGLARLRAEAGARFDPRVVEAVARRLDSPERLGRPGRVGFDEAASTLPATRLRDAARELHTLYEIERSVGYRLDPRENLLLVLGKLGSLVPHDTAVVYLQDEERGKLCARFALGGAAPVVEGLELAPDRMSARVALERRTSCGGPGSGFDLDDLRHDRLVSGLAATLAAPILDGERALGTLAIYAGPERQFGPDDRRVLVAVASYVAAALARSDPGDPAYLESLTDPSTGLPNARYLEICATDVAAGGSLGPARSGLLAFRWLDFHTACERNGVDAATRAMGVLGRRLAAACGPREVPVRYGTDLFVVLAPECDPDALVVRWNTLLQATEATPLELSGGCPLRVRLASAQSCAPSDGRSLEALLAALGARIGPACAEGARVVPFRLARSAG